MTPTEINQEKVNKILLGEGSLQELKPFFPNREAILNYHAQRLAELFPPNKNTNECECCHRHSAELQAVFEWRGIYHTTETAIVSTVGMALAIAITHHLFHFLMPSKHIDFSTTHGFCGDCFEQIRRRRMFAPLVKQLGLALIVISAVIFTSVIVFVILFLVKQPTKRGFAYAAIGFCSGFLCLAGGLLGTDRIVRWCLPKSLKFISKPPFQLVGFQKR
jgi:hypothetical protein